MDSQFTDIENPTIELVTMDISTTQEKSFFIWSYPKLRKSKSCPNTLQNEMAMCNLSLTSYQKEDLHIVSRPDSGSFYSYIREKWNNIDKFESINHHFSIFLHVSIMISFEIFFYFTYIINIERNEIIEKIDNYITELKRVETEGEIIAIDFFVDTEAYKKFYERVYAEYLQSSEEQKETLRELLKMACYISIPFYFMFIVFLGYGVYNRKKIKWVWLVYENIFMFLCLGVFEYVFFTRVILNYNPITDAELEYYILEELR